MRRCFYSALFAREGEPHPDILSFDTRIPGWDYILFTNVDITSDYWTIRKISMPAETPVLSAKTVKWLPHKFLPEFDVVCWLDACWSFDPRYASALEEQCAQLETHGVPIAIPKHPWVTTVYDELYAALRGHKITREHFTRIQNFFHAEGFTGIDTHYETKIMLWKVHDTRCIELSEKLVNFMSTLIYRDQIVLPYLLWQLSIDIRNLPDFTHKTGMKKNHVYTAKKEQRKVAICFWGLTRSLHFTFSSIYRNIFKPLRDAGIEYDIYLHTYTLRSKYSNQRAGEEDIILDSNEYTLLNPSFVEIEDQDEVDTTIPFEEYHSQGDPWPIDGNNFETLHNHIRSLRSLYKVTQQWIPKQFEYTHIMYCRPDVEYVKPIDTNWFSYLNKSVHIPNFALHTGVNDRFAIGRPQQMAIYGNRFINALEYSKKNLLHAEAYLAYTFESNNISVQLIDFIFARIRANGTSESRDAVDIHEDKEKQIEKKFLLNISDKSKKQSIAILYSAKSLNDQFLYFIENGHLHDKSYTFIIIAPNSVIQGLRKNLQKNMILVTREEKGGHFGAWSELLLFNSMYKNYDSFIFLNDDCVGPFIPPHLPVAWPRLFLQHLQGDIKLVGPTINTWGQPKTHSHIDTYCFAMNQETLEFCIEKGIFSTTYCSSSLVYSPFFPELMPEEFVEKKLKMSREIIKAGWNIKCFCKLYDNIDFRFTEKQPHEYSIKFQGELYGKGKYNGITMHPYETIFQHVTTPIPAFYL
jgi:hypothetical protein